jgi:hypothetical protein
MVLLRKMNKKGQEEIVGFVAIVVIVTVVLIMLFLITLGEDKENRDSRDLKLFLDSALEVTSNCSIGFEGAFANLRDLLKECNKGTSCVEGRSVCSYLEQETKEVLEASFSPSEEGSVKGYLFSAIYSFNEQKKELVNASSGKCLEIRRGAEGFVSDYPGTISYTLEVCS